MRQITMTTTQRNQVTIPAEVRRLLGIKPRDKVCFTIEDGGTVRVAAAAFSLESVYGSVTSREGRQDFDELTRIAKEGKVARTLRELREQ